jgi:hypothetical protein
MKRSTIEFDTAHYDAIKKLALSTKQSMKNVIRLIVHVGLEELSKRGHEAPKKFAPPTVRGIQAPRIDISDRNALFGVFDREREK